MSKILSSILDAELGAARYVSTANRGEILERTTAARAEHAEIVRILRSASDMLECAEWKDSENGCVALDVRERLDTLLSRIAPERAS